MFKKTLKLDLEDFSKDKLDSNLPRGIHYLELNFNTYKKFLTFLGADLNIVCLPQKYRKGRVASYRGAKIQINNNLSNGEIALLMVR